MNDEGGLRAPPGLGFWGKAWWWFHFLILIKLARLRFIAILLAIGIVIAKWDTITAVYERYAHTAAAEHAADSDTEYYCPMHPTVIRDNPKEKCPICFMPLSRRKKGDAKEEGLPPGIANRVQLSPYRVVLAGIQTSEVSYVPLSKEITTVGFVEFDERETKHIAARVKGRIDTLMVNETGVMVHAGEELASLYSPDLVSTMRDLANAKKAGNADLLRIAKERLSLWGIDKEQIAEIEDKGKANTHLKILSPIKGHIIKKYVKEGQYVDEGSPLYDIVDLSRVWIQSQVYEEDMAFLPYYHKPLTEDEAAKFGLSVTATTRAFPADTFTGKLTFVMPHVDQDTRTVMVRVELPNRDHKLRPGTSATVKLTVPPAHLAVLSKSLQDDWVRQTAIAGLGTDLAPLIRSATQFAMLHRGWVLAVPESAVIDTGSLRLVYREISPGQYEGVKVELGPRLTGPDDRTFYPVLQGLRRGDLIVTSGSFLVDAETRLNPAAGSIYFAGRRAPDASPGVNGPPNNIPTVRPSTPIPEKKGN